MKFEKTWVGNFEGAFRGLRNPKNSWDKSDSFFGLINTDYTEADQEIALNWINKYHSEVLDEYNYILPKGYNILDEYITKLINNGLLKTDFDHSVAEVAFIGPNDMKLAQTLIKAGPEHRKFLRQIFVSVDITAPMYFFSEFDTYKVATVANSTSKMHKLTSKPITLDCFEVDDFNPDLIYYSIVTPEGIVDNNINSFSDLIIEQLEFLRQKYIETKDKRYWKELVRWLPEGWLQTRTWTANYETIRAMCSPGQRRNHKLNEWSGIDDNSKETFIKWARQLPYAQYLIFDDENIPFQIEK